MSKKVTFGGVDIKLIPNRMSLNEEEEMVSSSTQNQSLQEPNINRMNDALASGNFEEDHVMNSVEEPNVTGSSIGETRMIPVTSSTPRQCLLRELLMKDVQPLSHVPDVSIKRSTFSNVNADDMCKKPLTDSNRNNSELVDYEMLNLEEDENNRPGTSKDSSFRPPSGGYVSIKKSEGLRITFSMNQKKESSNDLETPNANVIDGKENIPVRTPESLVTLCKLKLPAALSSDGSPLKVNRNELIWGCIEVGKSQSQEFMVGNKSANPVQIKCVISSTSFCFNNAWVESKELQISILPNTSCRISVIFRPVKFGPVADYISFMLIDSHVNQSFKQWLDLYGYGGFGNVNFDLVKDTSGKFLLPLGKIEKKRNLLKTFTIANTGRLSTFAIFDFVSNSLYSVLNVRVIPKTSLLLPGQLVKITVSLTLQPRDYRWFKATATNSVFDIGKLQVCCGTEINRMRLRQVCHKASQEKLVLPQCVLKLISELPEEVSNLDLNRLQETTLSLWDVYNLIGRETIAVSLEQSVSQSLKSENRRDLFYKMSATSAINPAIVCKDACEVEPKMIVLVPTKKVSDFIFITNHHLHSVYFEINETSRGLELEPQRGFIKAGATSAIKLKLVKRCDKTSLNVKVLVNNENFDVDVKIIGKFK